MSKELPVIFSICPGALIHNSIDIGMVKDEQNMAKFKAGQASCHDQQYCCLYVIATPLTIARMHALP